MKAATLAGMLLLAGVAAAGDPPVRSPSTVDKAGKVVASTETYNESAGALAVPDLSTAEKDALRPKLTRRTG